MPVDDRYTSGVWYDAQSGDYCEIEYNSKDEEVQLFVPGRDSPYFTMSLEMWQGEQSDFRRVPKSAVEDPAAYMEEWVNQQMRKWDGFDVGLIYADNHTKIVESE